MKNKYKDLENYCKRLGHPVPFSYCLIEKNDLPCSQVLNCWYEKIPVEEFIRDNYTPEEQTAIFQPAPEKITSILSLIDRVKNKH